MVKGATKPDGKFDARPYTPTTLNDEKGHFELIIKSYPEGNVSKHLHSLKVFESPCVATLFRARSLSGLVETIDLLILHNSCMVHCQVGDNVEVKGPFPKIAYTANMKKKIGMIAGGTGITPMLQVCASLLTALNYCHFYYF
jgi:cytochrome-b5 reductase